MTPMLYEPIATDRLETARGRAYIWRLRREANKSEGGHTIRAAVGQRLIAVGERLARQAEDPSGLREAA
jgi:hypothetical protein